jgi:CRP/FNR family transcriptional regulator, cyclic AMP receptor protein
MDRIELLRSVSFFELLDQADLEALAESLVERPYRAGDMVIEKGQAGHEMFIVASGHLNIHIPGDDSRRISLRDITRGECFGELAVFDSQPRAASVVATTDCVLLSLAGDTLTSFLQRRPGAALPILHKVARDLRWTTALLAERASRNAVREVERRAAWSDRFADRVTALNGSWRFIFGLLGVVLAWMVVNSVAVQRRPFDGYPYVFFNLVLAIVVAIQGPLIMMSQNRQAQRERAQADTDFRVNLKNEVNIETILAELGEMRAELNRRLEALERR